MKLIGFRMDSVFEYSEFEPLLYLKTWQKVSKKSNGQMVTVCKKVKTYILIFCQELDWSFFVEEERVNPLDVFNRNFSALPFPANLDIKILLKNFCKGGVSWCHLIRTQHTQVQILALPIKKNWHVIFRILMLCMLPPCYFSYKALHKTLSHK